MKFLPSKTALPLLGLLLAASGCAAPGNTGSIDEEQLYNTNNILGRPLFDLEGMAPASLAVRPFVRVGLMWDSPDDTALEGRFADEDGRWGPWRSIETVWSEGDARTGQLDVPSGSRQLFQLKLANGDAPRNLVAEAIEQVGEGQEPAQALPASQEPYASIALMLAPSSLVHPRSDWGARPPACSSGSHTPVRVTIHHTDTPLPDSISPQARLRQIQAYHIDTRGWCDIGYHFLIDWNGAAWQGRDERVIGAHVANHNTGNIGISYMGTYNTISATTAQITKGAKLLYWLHGKYSIPLNRDRIWGHRQWASTDCPGNKLYSQLDNLVKQAVCGGTCNSTPAKGTLSGVVYVSHGSGSTDTSDRIEGATVSVAGLGTKTAASGTAAWSFEAAAGTYTVKVSASGYQSGSRSCAVTSGKETTCSVGLVATSPGNDGEEEKMAV